MILLRLFYEFAKVGLFAVGGGLATIPFLQHMGVDAVFRGLRPASTALIASAGLSVAASVLLTQNGQQVPVTQLFYWPAILLTLVIFAAMKWTPMKKLHPIVFIAISAAAGVLFQL